MFIKLHSKEKLKTIEVYININHISRFYEDVKKDKHNSILWFSHKNLGMLTQDKLTVIESITEINMAISKVLK